MYRHWCLPLSIGPSAGDELDRRISYRDIQYNPISMHFRELTAEDCRLFCWKDCAIYANKCEGLSLQEAASEFPEEVYEEWFAHRARDQDLRNESYFAKLIRFKTPVPTVGEIARFHRALCMELVKLDGGILERESDWPFKLVPEERRPPGQFQLRPTFAKVFMVVDDGWETNGVLLVFTNLSVAKEFVGSASGGDALVQKHEDLDGSDLDEICIFQCPLKRAMKIVVSQDPERAG